MRTETRRVAVIPAVIALLLGAVAVEAATGPTGGSVEIAPLERPLELRPSARPSGVRTFGKAATWIELPDAPGVAAAGSVEARAVAATKLSGATMAGSVRAFAVDPLGARAVFIADKDTAGRYELYSVPVDGSSAPVKISSGLPFGTGDEGVSAFQIDPQGARVVFLADANHGAGSDDVFSAPIDGSAAPVQISDGPEAPVSAFGISPDGTRVAFLGVGTAFGTGGVELYVAAAAVAASANQVSDARRTLATGSVTYAEFGPNGARVVYAADAVTDEVYQWFSVPATATAPGSDVQLSSARGSVNQVAISPNGATVVYTADELLLDVLDVFAVPIAGGARLKLNPSMNGNGATTIAISPDGARVGYLADQDTVDVVEVYGARIGVAGSGVRLSAPMAGTQYADTLNIGPDSTTALYEADQNIAGTYELFRVPLDASAGSAMLHGVSPPDNAGYFSGLGTPIVGRRAVYPVLGATVDLYSVPFDGSAPYTRINDPLAAGQAVLGAFLPTRAERLLAYGVGSAATGTIARVFAAPIRRDLPPQQVNATAGAGALGVWGFEIASSETHAVWIQDQDTAGKLELYGAPLDSDGDGVANAADSCPFVTNPTQAAVPFGQTVRAVGSTTFAWSSPVDARYVRGPLASVALLATDASGTLTETASFSDPAAPAAGAGFYYLFAPDCPGRSWQTAPGAEPGRDAAGLP